MTSNQQAAVTSFLSLLSSVRGINLPDGSLTLETSGADVVLTGIPEFPPIAIGAKGGYKLPTIKSYPETGKGAHAYTYPGISALDAALFADRYATKAAKRVSTVAVTLPSAIRQANPTMPAIADPFTGFDNVPVVPTVVPEIPAITVEDSPETVSDEELEKLTAPTVE